MVYRFPYIYVHAYLYKCNVYLNPVTFDHFRRQIVSAPADRAHALVLFVDEPRKAEVSDHRTYRKTKTNIPYI